MLSEWYVVLTNSICLNIRMKILSFFLSLQIQQKEKKTVLNLNNDDDDAIRYVHLIPNVE